LRTFHPNGGHASSEFVNDEEWLDFHQIQSGHGAKNAKNYAMLTRDLGKQPARPVMDGEPAYEDHPVRGDKTHTQWFDDWDVRKMCYFALFAGAHGHTYGAHPIWQFWDGKSKPCADPRHSWKEAVQLPGATQVGYARRLLESRSFLTRVPDQSLVTSANPDGAEHIQATRDTDGTYAMIYSASGKPFTADLSKLKAAKLIGSWFDPRIGSVAKTEELENGGSREFTPPTSGEAGDWVLILDDAALHRTAPGLQTPK
jgi:hypothetical protein